MCTAQTYVRRRLTGFGVAASLLLAVLAAPAATCAATTDEAAPSAAGYVEPLPQPPSPDAVAPAPAPADTAPAVFTEYRIRLGDTLQFSVWGEPALTSTVVVMPDGTVSLPLVGVHAVVGKTVAALTSELQQAYQRYFKDPKISLSCTPRTPPQVYIEGSVRRAGPVEYDPRLRLLDYLALVGGPTPGADLSRVVVTSVSESEVRSSVVDLAAATPGAVMAGNVPLKAGDTVWVGRALPVSVVGAVRSPGAFDYRQGLRLSDYVGMAGGPTERARMNKTVLKHTEGGQNVTRTVDLSSALREPDTPELNPVLSPGDVVTVPEAFLAGGLEWGDVLRGVASVLIWWN